MEIGVDHVWPPSVVRENIGSPRKANERCRLLSLRLSPGIAPRIQAAYAVSSRVQSPVIDSLSLKLTGFVSRWMVTGALQLAPPFVDVDASTAESPRLAESMLSEIWYRRPSAPKLTHGSVARRYSGRPP